MSDRTRREFLADVGRGMLVAGLGYSAALDLGLTTAWAGDESGGSLDFGDREPLVRLMQETPPERLMSALAEQLRGGATLRDLVAAAALANARTFGGQDYVGFHTMMALTPAWHMARELPRDRQPLPVMKVLYRNTQRIQEHGGRDSEVLEAIELEGLPAEQRADGAALIRAMLEKDMQRAEQLFARIAGGAAEDAFNELLLMVQHETEVHRVVLPYRAWDLLDLVGRDHAHTLLRQSVRYCVGNESPKYSERQKGGRDVLPGLLDEYKLLSRPAGTRSLDDGWTEELCGTIFASSPEEAAGAVAAALAEGASFEAVGEAISLAANQLVLRDAGMRPEHARPERPAGSVHGASTGVHACDSINAWRNMARVSNHRNAVACLILAAYQVPRDRLHSGGEFLEREAYPRAEHLEQVRAARADELLREAEAAIRDNDQPRACAAVARYGETGADERPVFDLLLKYGVSEDGALHAEKYYRTVREEFASTRPAFRWRQLVGLARVTASQYGHQAPGLEEAERLLPTMVAGS